MASEPSSAGTKSNKDKIAKVLQKFLEPNFKIKNDVYLNLFLTHLVGKGNDIKKVINEEHCNQFCQWLFEASTLWDKKKVSPPSAIMSFALNLASQMSSDEQIFVKLNSQNVYETLAGISQSNLSNDASVTLGLVTLLCSFLDHKSGVQWVLATTYWTDIVTLGREAHTMYIRKQAYQFVAKLLEKTVSFNPNFCHNVVVNLIKPLHHALGTFNISPGTEKVQSALIENRSLFETLTPSLHFISEVLEILVKGLHSSALNIFVELKTSDMIRNLLMLSQIEDFSFELIKIRCILLFSKLGKESVRPAQGSARQVTHDAITLFDIRKMFDVIQEEMERDHVRCVIKISHYAHSLYCSLAGKMPLCIRKGEPIEFQNQMVLFQIMPIMKIINEIFKVLCGQGFKWKERLRHKPDLIEDMTFGLQYMVKSKTLLNKERAAIFFQPLVYSFKDFLTILEEDGYFEVNPSVVTFLQTLIETIIELVQSFDLTWRDSIETMCIMSMACKFLTYPQWEQKLMLSGLKLLNLALSKYMSPEMVLLMDNSKDSVVSHTGSLLYAKCHDTSWEIRDTALEIVHTLSLNAITKFPSYTNVLVDAELPQLVVQMALKDAEYYVRATAFKCLHELSQIEQVWNIYKAMDTFLEDILDVFEYETEGVVRKEAATLIHKISRFQRFPQQLLPRVYDVMSHAAIGDLHWEVKCNALGFWFNVVEIHLNNQGMIDCEFPTVTFSKEQRKIVNLNEAEVRRRIIKVLNQLSRIGCLHVFKSACLDDCDVEVARKACKFIVKFVKMLKMYKVPSENVDIIEVPPVSESQLSESNAECVQDSPQTSNAFYEPFSPFDVPLSPFSPSPALYSPCSPEQNHCPPTWPPIATQNRNTPSDQNVYGSNQMDFQLGAAEELAETKSTTSFDPVAAESVLDELLNSNDMAFLQQIYSPSDQVKNSTIEIKKSTVLAPSEFLKFIYREVERNAASKTQWLDRLDEFDSLLDDILKEYNVVPDVNNMDCY